MQLGLLHFLSLHLLCVRFHVRWFNNLYIKSSGDPAGTESYTGGTESSSGDPTPQDPELLTLVPSQYQKLFFEKYYRNKDSN